MTPDYYQQGYDAHSSGRHVNSNPYPEFGDKRFDEWDEGFFDAKDAAQEHDI